MNFRTSCISKGQRFGVVDGNDLQKNLLVHFSQLKRFHFIIYPFIFQLNNQISKENDCPSDDDLKSINGHQFGQVRSYVHGNCSKKISGCHVYSISFQFKAFL